MRLSVHNLGRIRDAELEIQPITVLYGANNSCKTWLANAAYSSARRLSLEGRMNGFVWPGPAEGKLHPQLQRIAAEARAALDVRDGAEYSYTLKFADVPGPQDGYVGHAGALPHGISGRNRGSRPSRCWLTCSSPTPPRACTAASRTCRSLTGSP